MGEMQLGDILSMVETKAENSNAGKDLEAWGF